MKQETELLEQELKQYGQEERRQDDANHQQVSKSDDTSATLKVLLQLRALQDRLSDQRNQEKHSDSGTRSDQDWQKDARNILSSLSTTAPIAELESTGKVNDETSQDSQDQNRTRDLSLLDSRISGIEELVGVKQVLTGVDEVSLQAIDTLTKIYLPQEGMPDVMNRILSMDWK